MDLSWNSIHLTMRKPLYSVGISNKKREKQEEENRYWG